MKRIVLAAAFYLPCAAQDVPAESALNAGKVAFDKGQYRDAIQLFEQARSHDCRVSFYIGVARYRLGEGDEAIRSFQAAAECDPKFAPARVALAEAYAQRGDTARALTAFEAALEIDPKNADALRGASRIHLDAQSNDKVIAMLETLVSIEPRDIDAKSQLAAAYAATSRFAEAEVQFRSALETQPSHLSAMTGLANVLLKTGRSEEAVLLLQKAASASTSAYEPLFVLGSMYNSSGEPRKAAEALERAVKLAPNEPEVWYQLATAYGKLERVKDRQRALESFRLAKERSQESRLTRKETAAAIETAGSLVRQGDLRKAARVLEAALEKDGRNGDLLFRTAGLHFDLGAYERARKLVNEAIGVAPSEWRYEYLRGLVEKSDHRLNEAKKAMKAAMELNPKAPDVHNQMGDLELRAGNPGAAVEHFKRAAELDPDDSSYRLNLEAALRQVRDH